MRYNKLTGLFIVLITAIVLFLLLKPQKQIYVYLNDEKSIEIAGQRSNSVVRKIYQSWRRCMTNKTASFRGNPIETWDKIANTITECEKPFVQFLKIKDFPNGDEVKRHILPLTHSPEKTIVITLGIGHDTAAEERLLQHMGNNSLDFYGADPMVEVNEKLYSGFGKFFPFAVSAKPGFSIANVLEGQSYIRKTVIHIDAVYFLTKLVGKRFIDTIWMDAENAEYELFPFMKKGGEFDKNDIVICQLNLEIHSPNEQQKQLAHNFLFDMLDDERYALFQPVQLGHLRLFFVNFENKNCAEKYIPISDNNSYALPF